MSEMEDQFVVGDWGDDDDGDDECFDEALLSQACAEAEENLRLTLEIEQEERKNEEKQEENRLQQFKNQFGRSGANDPSLNPQLAAQAFNARREILQTETDLRATTSPSLSTEATMSQVDYLRKQFAEEKKKNKALTERLFAATGESGILRKQVERLKNDQHEETLGRLKRQQEDKQRLEEERRKIQIENNALRTQLRAAKNDNQVLQSKLTMKNSPANRGYGGAQSQVHVPKGPYSASGSVVGMVTVSKPRSDPNLRTPSSPGSTPALQTLDVSSLSILAKKPKVEEGSVQFNFHQIDEEARDKQLFTGEPGAESMNIKSVEDISTLNQNSIRRQIFERIYKMIHIDFQINGKSVLDKIVAQAPKEIMAKRTRGIEIRTCFPDLNDTMFLYGVQSQQKQKNQQVMKTYPKLGSNLNPPILNMERIKVILESNFVYDSAWKTLNKIKEQLQKLLTELQGDSRFRLYEYANLHSLWILLAWTKHLWKFVVFEEELDEKVKSQGNESWIKELKEWTGLILKIDWRDYFVPETEQLVRGYCLSILEIIVTAGYFDSTQRRYEILYCILKDTLTKDHLRCEESLRRCLNIITWSITDNRNILNYLCIGNNNVNCLARVLGENVLKCFMKLENPYKATTLFLHYCHLLESLMTKRPPRHFSSVASPPNDGPDNIDEDSDTDNESDVETKTNESSVNQGDMEMETDMMCTQFACSEKYKMDALEDGTSQRAKKFNKVKAASCWINPVEWEVPIDESRSTQDYPCQCRKVLLGSTFIMLNRIVEWWKASIVKRDEMTEKLQGMELVALQKMKEERSDIVRKEGYTEEEMNEMIESLTRKMDSLREFVIKFQDDDGTKPKKNGSKEENKEGEAKKSKKHADEDIDNVREATWDVILQDWMPPEELNPKKSGYDDKMCPLTVFDLAMRSGVELMNFCHFHSNNIALAAGSEAFNCFTLLIAEIKALETQPCFTAAEKRFLMEIIRSGEDDSETISGSSYPLTDDEDDEDNTGGFGLLPEIDDEQITYKNIPIRPKAKFDESEFEREFKLTQKQMKRKDLMSASSSFPSPRTPKKKRMCTAV